MQLSNINYKKYYRSAYQYYRARPAVTASIEVILTVFAVSIMVTAAIRPTLEIVATLRKKIEDQELVDKKLTNKIGALRSAQQSLSEHENEIGLYLKAVPNGHDIGGLTKRLEALAQKSNLTIEIINYDELDLIDNINIDTEENTPQILTLPISMNIMGEFGQIKEFIKQIESIDRLVKIEKLSIEKQGELEKTNTISITVEALAYYKIN